MGGASGSTGIWKGGAAMRAAAAEARSVLVGMAAEKLGVPADQLDVDNGVVSAKADPAKKVTYAALVGGQHFDTLLTWNKQVGSDLTITLDSSDVITLNNVALASFTSASAHFV